MRVLHITNAYPSDNHPLYGIFIKEQIESLRTYPIQTSVYFINAREKGKGEYLKSLPAIIRQSRTADIIHCHHLLSAIPLLLFKPFIKPTIIVSFMSDGANEILIGNRFIGRRFKKWAYEFVIRKADARVFKKNVPNSLLTDGCSFYLPNGVNTSFFKPIDKLVAKREIGLHAAKDYILFVSLGDLNRREKRYDKFKKVINILRKEKGFTGIEELHLTSIPRDKVVYYFNASVLHLLTSDFEGSPNSVKEALACNIPVVTTDVGNLRSMIVGSETCKISKTGTAEDLADLVSEVLTMARQEDLRRKFIENKLDSQTAASNLYNIYEHVYTKQSVAS